MSIQFTADEMLRVAEQIERNGIAFYTCAAPLVTAAAPHALLLRLASWEESHAALFVEMRRLLREEEREAVSYDPDDQVLLYLRAFAEGVVFPAFDRPEDIFGAEATPSTILRIALEREEDSILFYSGMRGYVPARLGADKLERIIREEYGHIVMLRQQLAAL